MYDKRIEVLFVVGMVIGILAIVFMAFQCMFPFQDKPELIIPARGCLFRIESNNTPEFFTEVFMGSRLKIVIDDEIYWIEVVKDGE